MATLTGVLHLPQPKVEVATAAPRQQMPQNSEGPTRKPAKTQHVTEFDGLRGLAAIAVAGFHYLYGPSLLSRACSIIRHGINISPAALDMFFILSGFLIGGMLLRTKDSPGYFKGFYVRRFCRILPLYFAWLLIYALLVCLLPGWGTTVPKGWTLVSLMAVYFLFSQNFTTTYIGSLCLSPLWTLAVEEHFYLLAPVFVRRLTKRQFLTGVFALIAAAPLVRFLFYLHFHADPQWTWDGVVLPLDTWTFCRMDSLALGVGLAIAWETKRGRDFIKSHIRHFHIGLALFVALTAVSEYIQMKHIQSLYAAQQSLADTVLSLSSLCLIIIALADPKSWISSVLRWSWLRRLGRVGYCFYLIHWGVYWAMLRFAFHSELGRNLYLELALAPVCFAITWSLAELSWRWFEFPIIQFGRRYIPQPARPAAAHLAPVPSTT